MKIIRSLILVCVDLASVIFTSYLVMVHGWGLEVKSWSWVIFGNIGGLLISQLILTAAKSDDE